MKVSKILSGKVFISKKKKPKRPLKTGKPYRGQGRR